MYLHYKHDYEIPEMWCSRVHALFKKFLKDNSQYFSENDYIRLIGSVYTNGKFIGRSRTFYIYCTVYDSLVFLHNGTSEYSTDDHLKECIKKEKSNSLDLFLQAIAKREIQISLQKKNIAQFEAEIKRL